MPPLNKKALRSPGAVFKMLETHATERLAQDATLEEAEGSQNQASSMRGKFHTFFQLCLKPQLDPRSRDSKELFLLSRVLDLLKQGALDQLADVLASRMMAVETASKQGWATARFLEVLDEGDETSTPPHILLAAQRHSRLVEKAGGLVRRLGIRRSTKRKSKGEQRKREKRQGKRKRWKECLGRMVGRSSKRRRTKPWEEGEREGCMTRRGEAPSLGNACSGISIPCELAAGRPAPATRLTDMVQYQLSAGEIAPCDPIQGVAAHEEGQCGTTNLEGIETTLLEFRSGGAGDSLSGCPLNRPDWLATLEQTNDLVSLCIALARGLSRGFIPEVSLLCAEPSRLAGRKSRSGELFPLPVIIPDDIMMDGDETTAEERFRLSVRWWTALGCASINALYKCPRQGFSRRPGKVHTCALRDMEDKVERFLKGEKPMGTTFEEVVADVKCKRVSYAGEEISQPYPLSVSQITKGLPPVGHGASIPVCPFLRGRTRYLMENPLESLLEVSERGATPVTARVHTKRGEELSVFNLLQERGITEWVTEDTAYRDERGTYLSGIFGVIKPNKFTSEGLPVLRVITNLIPANGLFSVLRGDIDFLPNATEWLPMAVAEGEQVVMNQADMQSAFYLFAIPSQWYPFFCLNFTVKGSEIGKEPHMVYRPAIKVLPMGWSSSVGVMQQISGEILLSHGLPPELELRKSGSLPLWFTQVMEATTPTRLVASLFGQLLFRRS